MVVSFLKATSFPHVPVRKIIFDACYKLKKWHRKLCAILVLLSECRPKGRIYGLCCSDILLQNEIATEHINQLRLVTVTAEKHSRNTTICLLDCLLNKQTT